MLDIIYTFFCYAFSATVLIVYLFFTINSLVYNDATVKGHSLNLISFFLILFLLILLLARAGRFEQIGNISDLMTNVGFIFGSIWIGIKYAFLGAVAPSITIFVIIVIIILLFLLIFSNSYTQMIRRNERSKSIEEIKLADIRLSSARVDTEMAYSERSEAISLLDDKSKELSKKTLELAKLSSQNTKLLQFWNENKDKVPNFDNKLKNKDSKIKELEEIIKRRELQIQRLKKSRNQN